MKQKPLFALGMCLGLGDAVDLSRDIVGQCFERHARGDWGELCHHDWKENEVGLTQGLRLFSRYKDRHGTYFYIITEHDRSVTTVLLPDDY